MEDQFGVLTERLGLKPQGKSAPMAASKRYNNTGHEQTRNFAHDVTSNLTPSYSLNSARNSKLGNKSSIDDFEVLFHSKNPQDFGGLDDGFDVFGASWNSLKQNGPMKSSSRSSTGLVDPGDLLSGFDTISSSTEGLDELVVKSKNGNLNDSLSAAPSQMPNTAPYFQPPPNAGQVMRKEKVKSFVSPVDDLETLFSLGPQSSSLRRPRNMTSVPVSNMKMKHGIKDMATSTRAPAASSAMRKAHSVPNIVDDLFSLFDGHVSEKFKEIDGESEERRNARLGRHKRIQDRVAKAVADLNQRDIENQQEQQERRNIADNLDAEICRWAAGKEGNIRAMLSSLHHVLWPECGWEAISLTDLITSASVKRVYKKATLCVHPDKVQQKGATIRQKYAAEKVFDILKEAWKKFAMEELK